jgi:uncharacterized membrane protein (DUF373 family)
MSFYTGGSLYDAFKDTSKSRQINASLIAVSTIIILICLLIIYVDSNDEGAIKVAVGFAFILTGALVSEELLSYGSNIVSSNWWKWLGYGSPLLGTCIGVLWFVVG